MPQSKNPVRLHVQESKNSLDVFRVTEERLRPAIEAVPGLQERVHVTYGDDRGSLDRGLENAEILMVGNFDSENLEVRAPRLKWVQSIFAGVEKLLPVIPRHVALTNASGVHAPKAGEYGICALLMLNSQVPNLAALQRRKEWEPIFTPVIAGKTVVILGTGNIGAAIAGHARHFGLRTIGVSRGGHPAEPFDEVFPVGDLHAALAGADFLVVTLPSTKDTAKLVGAAELTRLAKGAGIVSVGRGEAVDEAALVEALRSGHLGGAVLDVFEAEPLPPGSPLWTMDNVLVSAHCGVDDLQAYLPRAIDVFIGNLRHYLDGEPLENLIDRDAGY